MSERVALTLRANTRGPLDLRGITPDRCAQLSEREIAALPLWHGGAPASLGDLFDVRGERSLRLEIEGELGRVSGVGAGMTGGVMHVHGSVGDDAGQAMAGGALRIDGHAGDRLGGAPGGASKGMTGGEIVVFGSAGAAAAGLMRRGLVAVAGRVGGYAGRGMIAGTLVALGPIGEQPGLGSKRGSIIGMGEVEVPPTYRYACTFEPPHLRVLLTSLQRRFGFPVEARLRDGRYRRYCGDACAPGKGEILVWSGDEELQRDRRR
jgi:formylmethanofuran dehydrogenase subunit C